MIIEPSIAPAEIVVINCRVTKILYLIPKWNWNTFLTFCLISEQYLFSNFLLVLPFTSKFSRRGPKLNIFGIRLEFFFYIQSVLTLLPEFADRTFSDKFPKKLRCLWWWYMQPNHIWEISKAVAILYDRSISKMISSMLPKLKSWKLHWRKCIIYKKDISGGGGENKKLPRLDHTSYMDLSSLG